MIEIGFPFPDLSDPRNMKRIELGKSERHTAFHGLIFEGICDNSGCSAKDKKVRHNWGEEVFDLERDAPRIACPMCHMFMAPTTCAFRNCKWMYTGSKFTWSEGAIDVSSRGKWLHADDGGYYVFDEHVMARWTDLVITTRRTNSSGATALTEKIGEKLMIATKPLKGTSADVGGSQTSTSASHATTRFSKDMSDTNFMSYLNSEGVCDNDCHLLIGNGIRAKGFLVLTDKDFDNKELSISFGGRKLLKKLLNDLKESERRESGSYQSHGAGIMDGMNKGGDRFTDSDYEMIYSKLESHAMKWKDIGLALGFTKNELDLIEHNPMLLLQSPPKSWFGQMLSQWLQWAPGDGRGSTGFATQSSLHAALLKANLGALAEQFK